jgi:hypothetical protein
MLEARSHQSLVPAFTLSSAIALGKFGFAQSPAISTEHNRLAGERVACSSLALSPLPPSSSSFSWLLKSKSCGFSASS